MSMNLIVSGPKRRGMRLPSPPEMRPNYLCVLNGTRWNEHALCFSCSTRPRPDKDNKQQDFEERNAPCGSTSPGFVRPELLDRFLPAHPLCLSPCVELPAVLSAAGVTYHASPLRP
ncbi:hypothetical protein E4U17_005370 [Claviceps sp. LM77 group G4]|nr:hypothetical protein E4U17_005370 [Claviceps sp. LM77 group G4]